MVLLVCLKQTRKSRISRPVTGDAGIIRSKEKEKKRKRVC